MRGLHSADPQCAICTHPEGIRAVAAHEFGDHVPAAHPNPHDITGNGQWFHGTSYDPKLGGFQTADERGEDDDGGWRHWNTHLGTHFTSQYMTAKNFAKGMKYSPSHDQAHARIAHASLHMEQPMHYPSEHDMSRDAFHWGRKNGFNDYDRGEEYDEDEEDHHWLNKSMAESGEHEDWIRGHPRVHELAHGFKQHLQGMGFDGITYGNEHEKPYGHLSAIAFKETPVKVNHWDYLHPQQKTAMGMAGPDYDNLTFKHRLVGDDGEEDAPWGSHVLSAHHPEHGEVGKVAYLDLEHPESSGFPERAIHIDMLRVKPNHRRRGVASQLMAHLDSMHPDVPIDHGTRTRMGEAWGRHMYGRESKPKPGHTFYNPDSGNVEPTHYDADWTLGGKPWSLKTRRPLRPQKKKVNATFLKEAELPQPHSRDELIAHAEGHQTLYKPAGEEHDRAYGDGLCGAHAAQLEKERQTRFSDLGIRGMDDEGEKPEHRWNSVGKGSCGTCTRHQNEWRNKLPGQYGAPLDGPRMSPERRPRFFNPKNQVPFDPKMFHGLDQRQSSSDDDYRMNHRPGGPNPEEGDSPAHDLENSFPDFYSRPHLYNHHQHDGLFGGKKVWDETVSTLKRARGNPEAPVTMYRSLPPEHAHKGFGTGDWVSVHPDYARGHGLHESDEKEDWPVIKATVPAKHLWNNGDMVDEFGYHGPPVKGEIHFPGGENAAKRLRREGRLDLHQVRVLNPTSGHDPYLFDGDRLKPEVRKTLIARWRNFCAQHQLRDWMGWAQLYFTGGEASEWSGPGSNPNGDFDMQVGIDFDDFREANPQFSSQNNEAISMALNAMFWISANDHDFKIGDRVFDLTWYSNPAVCPDIKKINPYAAYDVLGDKWAVHPKSYKQAPHLPSAVRKALQGAETYARQVLSLPEPQRTREAAALFESWHNDRSKAFEPGGQGVFDYANLRMKALEATGVWQQLQDAANRIGKTGTVQMMKPSEINARPGRNDLDEPWMKHKIDNLRNSIQQRGYEHVIGDEIRLGQDEDGHVVTDGNKRLKVLREIGYDGPIPVRTAVIKNFDELEPHEQAAVREYHPQKAWEDEPGHTPDETVHDYTYDVRSEPRDQFIKRYMDASPEFKKEYGPDQFDEHHQQTLRDHHDGTPDPIPHHPRENRWPIFVNDKNPDYVDDGYHRFHSYERDGADHFPTIRMNLKGKTAAREDTIAALNEIGMKEHPNVDHYRSGGIGHMEGDESRSVVGFMPTHTLFGYEGNPTHNRDVVHKVRDDINSGRGITNPLMMVYDHKNRWAYLGEGNHRLEGATEAAARTVPVRFVRGDASYEKANHIGGPMHMEEKWHGGMGEPYVPTDIHPHHFMKTAGQAGPDYEGLHFKYYKNYNSVHDEPHWLDGNDKHDRRSFFGMMAFRPGEKQSVGTLEFSPHDYGNGDREVTLHGLKVNEEHQRRGVGKALMNEVMSRYHDVPINHGIKTEQGEAFTRSTQGIESPKTDNPGHSSQYGEAPYEEHWTLGGKPYRKSSALVDDVRSHLTDDLLKTKYRDQVDRKPTSGHCYAASEAMYHMMGGKGAGWTPMQINHEGDSHWFLKHRSGEIVDPTSDQFETPVPYEKGVGRGFLTKQPSSRAQTIIDRVQKTGTVMVDNRHWGKGLNSLFPVDEDGPKLSTSAPWPQAGGRTDRELYDKELVNRSITHPHEFPIEDVDPRTLHAMQPKVLRSGVQHYMEHSDGPTYSELHTPHGRPLGNDIPRIYRHENGKNLILTGHHRGAAALVKGEPLRAMIIHGGWGPERKTN